MAFVLREVWRPVPIDPGGGRATRLDRFAERHPSLGRRVHPGIPAAAAVGVLLVAGPWVWSRVDDPLRFLIVAGLVAVGLGWALAVWLIDR